MRGSQLYPFAVLNGTQLDPRFWQIGDGDGDGPPIPGKSGMDPRSPANRGWDPHPHPRTNRGWGWGWGSGVPCPGSAAVAALPVPSESGPRAARPRCPAAARAQCDWAWARGWRRRGVSRANEPGLLSDRASLSLSVTATGPSRWSARGRPGPVAWSGALETMIRNRVGCLRRGYRQLLVNLPMACSIGSG
jgi:hypothetical protein